MAPRDTVPIPRDAHGVLKPTTDTLGPRSPREGVRVGPTTPAADPADENESVTITEACAVRLYLPHWPTGPCGGCCSAGYWGQRQAQARGPGFWHPLLFQSLAWTLWDPFMSHLGPLRYRALALLRLEPEQWVELLWPMGPHPVATPAFSLAEQARASGWSVELPHPLVGPQA